MFVVAQKTNKQNSRLVTDNLNYIRCLFYMYNRPHCLTSQSINHLCLFTIIGGSCHKYHFCRDKHVFVRVCREKTRLLSRQKYAQPYFCPDKILSRQAYFVATKVCLSRQKTTTTKTNFCRNKHKNLDKKYFLATNIILSRRKFCRGKHTFVSTKDVFLSRQT